MKSPAPLSKGTSRPCHRCHGTGKLEGKPCPVCKGKGELSAD